MTSWLPKLILDRSSTLKRAEDRRYRKRVAAKALQLAAGLQSEAGLRAVNAERAASAGKAGQ